MIRILLALLALLTPAMANAEWHEASSPHFVVYSDGSPERLAKFAADLERFDKAVRMLRGMPDNPVGRANRVTVYMLNSVEAVSKLSGRENVAGFYQARSSGSVAFVPRAAGTQDYDLSSQQILFHEYAHHLMLSTYANSAFPSWLIEGYAEYHATARLEKDGSIAFGAAPQYRGYGLLSGNPLPLARILAADTSKLDAAQTDALYGRGWALTHLLTGTPERRAQLGRYVADINGGKTAAEASQAFGDLRTLDRELGRYITSPRFKGFGVTPPALPADAIKIRPLTPGEVATMAVRIRSSRGVDEKTAQPLYADAKKVTAPYGSDPGAQMVLAEAAYDAKDYVVAEQAADRALAADPKLARAYAYKAMARMAVAHAAKDYSPATWTAIRKLAAAGNRIDEDDPELLILFYRSFAEAGQAPTKNARQAIYAAFEMAPQDNSLRLTTAEVYLNEGKTDMAIAMLRPLAFNPHAGALGKTAAKRIAEIQAGTATPKSSTTSAAPAAADKSGGGK